MIWKVKKTFTQLSVWTDKSDIILRERPKSQIIQYVWQESLHGHLCVCPHTREERTTSESMLTFFLKADRQKPLRSKEEGLALC